MDNALPAFRHKGGFQRVAAGASVGKITSQSRRFTVIGITALLLVVAGVALSSLMLRGKVLSLTLKDYAIDSIAVLPFANEGADQQTDYLSDGIAESLINSLSSLSRLRVTAWSTVRSYKAKKVATRDVGRELGVKAALTVRVVQHEDSLIITTELLDVADGSRI